MIVEHEIIEQIEDERNGRSLAWVCGLARQHGKDAPLRTLERMWREGYVVLYDDRGNVIASWHVKRFGARAMSLNV